MQDMNVAILVLSWLRLLGNKCLQFVNIYINPLNTWPIQNMSNLTKLSTLIIVMATTVAMVM